MVHVNYLYTQNDYRHKNVRWFSAIIIFLLGDIFLGSLYLTVESDLNGATPHFTLTCYSYEGPATTVTWTRDNVTVTEGVRTGLEDPMHAFYTHTLTVTGRQEGLYTCTVANNKPSNASANLTVQGICVTE